MKEITDSVQILKILQQEKNLASSAQMWISISDQIVLVPFSLIKVDLDSRSCWCQLKREDESFSTLLAKNPEIKCFFPQSGVYIFTTLHTYKKDSQLLKIKIPNVIYSKERRGDQRFDITGELSLKVLDGEINRSYKVFDISKGGLSIILSKTDRLAIEESGAIIEGLLMPFSIPMQLKMTSILRVRPFIFENIPYAGKKISFQFSFGEERKALRWEKIWPQLLSEVV